MTLTVSTVDELRPRAGEELGASSYRLVNRDDVDAFAQITGDRQWIHADPERAGETPFGGTIVHGDYTLAVAPTLLAEVLPLDGFAMVISYGLDKLRFPAPPRVGESFRMRVGLDEVQDIPGGTSLILTLSFEREAPGKPVCVAQALYRVYEGS